MPESRPLRVFLCHASQDKTAVRDLYSRLKSEVWVDPWLDEEKLLPGMDWDLEIQKAIDVSDVIIVCLSNESISKEGYVQREFKRALYLAEEKPEGTIFVIPLRLDDCSPPSKFQKWHWLDYFAPNAHKRLLQSLTLRADSLKIQMTTKFNDAVSDPLVFRKEQITVYKMEPALKKMKLGEYPIYTFGGLEFVRVPAGDFYMGAEDIDAYGGAAKPQHLIYQLDYDFYISRFLITNTQYISMARETGVPVVMDKGKFGHPAKVSWYEAQTYIEWFNKKHRVELLDGYRFCLPSEAEWEKAARGSNGNEYPWGDQFDKENCNTREGGMDSTSQVGKYSPMGDSPYGCADMSGNVWEWTRSLWGRNYDRPSFRYPYRFDDARENENVDRSIHRVIRGGSYKDYASSARCAYRNGASPSYNTIYPVGFRVSVSPMKD